MRSCSTKDFLLVIKINIVIKNNIKEIESNKINNIRKINVMNFYKSSLRKTDNLLGIRAFFSSI